jgi:hypothetical protein
MRPGHPGVGMTPSARRDCNMETLELLEGIRMESLPMEEM